MPSLAMGDKHQSLAAFATTSRLVACLVTELLVPAYYVPAKHGSSVDIAVVLWPSTSKPNTITADTILAVIALRQVPMLSQETLVLGGRPCSRISLVDGLDMLSCIVGHALPSVITPVAAENKWWEPVMTSLQSIFPKDDLSSFCEANAVTVWQQFATAFPVKSDLAEEIGQELASSMDHQAYEYNHPKPLPTLQSSTIEWEHAILEGHATHPMHKARKSFPPMPLLQPGETLLDYPRLRLISLPRSSVTIRGDFEWLIQPLIDSLLSPAHREGNRVVMPVHELQIPNIESKFPDAVLLPLEHSMVVNRLASARSIAVPEYLPGLSLKLCLGIKISSALRTITPFTTYFGPGFSRDVVPRLTYDHDILTIERELASVIYKHDDSDVAKHCSCVVREAIEYGSHKDLFVPCAALVEKIQRPDTDETLVTLIWGLDKPAKRAAFFERYVDLVLRAFLPPVLVNGVAFEAHGQNTLARFDRDTGLLKGFVIRDFGGVKVHRPTLRESCGVDIDVLPNSCVVAEELDEAYKLLYHTLFYCHLQRLIRVLQLHSDGSGWDMVRNKVAELVPSDHPLATWLTKTHLPGKCLLRMKIEELYRDYIYEAVPNLLLYTPHSTQHKAETM